MTCRRCKKSAPAVRYFTGFPLCPECAAASHLIPAGAEFSAPVGLRPDSAHYCAEKREVRIWSQTVGMVRVTEK